MSGSYDNTNYGYAVATNKTYVAITNPSRFVYDSTANQTGSVEVLQYDIESDSYKHKDTIKKILSSDVYISTESPEVITTEVPVYNLLYEYDSLYLSSSKFGKSVALFDTTIAIGDPLYYYKISVGASDVLTGSGVDIYSLSGSSTQTASYITTISNSFESNYNYNTSFGEAISLYDNVLAIGASSISGSKGAVYLYKKVSNIWSYYQTLTGSATVTGSSFGGAVKIDQNGSYNIVVGNKATGSGLVYVFSYNSSSGFWKENSVLYPNRNLTQSLQVLNNNWPPYITSSSNPDGFGNSVAIYGSSILVGAPTDTKYLQYQGAQTASYCGAVYFFENCTDDNISWMILGKSFGSADTLTNNHFGWDVEIYNTMSLVSSIKDNWPYSASYIDNTFYKKFDCNPNDYTINVLGQIISYQKTSGSSWNVLNTITKNKKFGDPYKVYGYDVGLYDTSIVVGAPVIVTQVP